MIPVMCVIYSFATELTYPISEALFGSVLQLGSCVFGTLIAFFASFIINGIGANWMILLYAVFFLGCTILASFVKEDLKRMKMEAESSQEQIVDIN